MAASMSQSSAILTSVRLPSGSFICVASTRISSAHFCQYSALMSRSGNGSSVYGKRGWLSARRFTRV